jgi:hypothetical protein
MSKQREALKIALKVLNTKQDFNYPEFHALQYQAFNMVYEALAEPEQEPVAWMYHGILHTGTPHDRPSLILRPEYIDAMSAKMGAKATPLYTAPPARKPLTDEEIDNLELPPNGCTMRELVRAIERAHGIGEP